MDDKKEVKHSNQLKLFPKALAQKQKDRIELQSSYDHPKREHYLVKITEESIVLCRTCQYESRPDVPHHRQCGRNGGHRIESSPKKIKCQQHIGQNKEEYEPGCRSDDLGRDLLSVDKNIHNRIGMKRSLELGNNILEKYDIAYDLHPARSRPGIPAYKHSDKDNHYRQMPPLLIIKCSKPCCGQH